MALKRWKLPLLVGATAVAVWFAITNRLYVPPMQPDPTNYNPLLVRTDFSNETAWLAVRAGAMEIEPELKDAIEAMKVINPSAGVDVSGYGQPIEFVTIVDDPINLNLELERALDLAAEHDSCIFVADQQTMKHPDHPVLVVDLAHKRGRAFRAVPSEVGAIASNLSISNMDWEDFAEEVDAEGIYRGFPPSP